VIFRGDYGNPGAENLTQAHGIGTVGNPDAQSGTASSGFNHDCHTRPQTEACHFAQSRGVAVGHAANHGRDATSPFRQRHLRTNRNCAISLGNRVAVRIGLWISQFRGDPIFKPLRNEVLQPFCLIVNLIPRIVEEITEETLQQTVTAKNLQSAHFPRCSQTRAVVLLVFHKRWLLCRELLEHSGYGSGTDTKTLSKGVAGHPFLLGAAQFQYRFQIIVHRFRGARSVNSRWH